VGSLAYVESQRVAHFHKAMEALAAAEAKGCRTEDLAHLAQWIFERKA
jgi:hypothetical protein